MKKGFLALAVSVTAALVCGCAGMSAVVSDSVSEQIPLSSIKLAGGKCLKVSEGGALKMIPLNQLKRVTLHSYETITINRELYYLADIELRDGSQLAAERAGWNVTFVCIHDIINGKSDKDKTTVRIPLDKVSRIVFK